MAETRFIIDPDIRHPAILYKGEIVGFIERIRNGEALIQLTKQLEQADKSVISTDVSSAMQFMPDTFNAVLFEAGNKGVNKEAEKALTQIPADMRARVELGGGFDGRPGFLNLDMRIRENSYDGDNNCLTFDLRQGLPPFPSGSVDYIYSSHFLEHLTFEECLRVVTDSYQALCGGGRFRAALPNARLLVENYVKHDPNWLQEMRESVALLKQMPHYMRNFGDILSCGRTTSTSIFTTRRTSPPS